ncbi:hypothetical protein [Kitasatospora sp. GP82]|uniref:hypothetical protein n=1 Tax=Kitasatospora sp. GP82 TaxID=3035089 RepID=UPI002473237A|nr:hypothetical protein [Kitasatospora sp. GP82]MDH6128276.1 hypothetical protein [Kitasatospora sp. GP82]
MVGAFTEAELREVDLREVDLREVDLQLPGTTAELGSLHRPSRRPTRVAEDPCTTEDGVEAAEVALPLETRAPAAPGGLVR